MYSSLAYSLALGGLIAHLAVIFVGGGGQRRVLD